MTWPLNFKLIRQGNFGFEGDNRKQMSRKMNQSENTSEWERQIILQKLPCDKLRVSMLELSKEEAHVRDSKIICYTKLT